MPSDRPWTTRRAVSPPRWRFRATWRVACTCSFTESIRMEPRDSALDPGAFPAPRAVNSVHGTPPLAPARARGPRGAAPRRGGLPLARSPLGDVPRAAPRRTVGGPAARGGGRKDHEDRV